jgi:hypothetical protein
VSGTSLKKREQDIRKSGIDGVKIPFSIFGQPLPRAGCTRARGYAECFSKLGALARKDLFDATNTKRFHVVQMVSVVQ